MPHSPTVFEHPPPPPNLMFDNPSSFHVEDFFNLDLLADDAVPSASASTISSSSQHDDRKANSGASSHSSTSRASSETRTDSPAGSFANLQTPPQAEAFPSFDITGLGMGINFDSSAFGGLPSIAEESVFTVGNNNGNGFFKPGSDPLAGLSHSTFDLFSSLDAQLNGATSSDANSTSSTSNVNSSTPPSAIDPQLVGTPVDSTPLTDATSDVGAEPDSDEDEPRGLVIAPVKVGGKGKARRGTLHSGGISKKSAPPGPQSIFGSLSAESSGTLGKGSGKGGNSFGREKLKDKDQDEDEKDDDADDWRPSPEEYAKMSSKEKRQLRNKISARNFRIRRKEYIHTLEGDIADRDRLIEAIRSELGSTKSENHALRQEVTALKKAILEGRASPMLPPPAPLSPLSPLSSFASLPGSSASSIASASSNSSNNLIKPNTHKDLPTSPRLGASPFWGGQAGGFGSLGGGITSVHTAIIPETASSVFSSNADRQKENMNPALNAQAQQQPQQQQVLSQVLSQLYGNSPNNDTNNVTNKQNAFDSFVDVNPFTLKTLDAYRMQLWGRLATQVQHTQRSRPFTNAGYPSPPHSSSAQSAKSSSTTSSSMPLSGLASSLRPQYFASANTNSSPSSTGSGKPFGALLSGKGLPYGHHASHGLPTPPSSPQQRPVNHQQQQKEREQVQTHALLATLACQTVLHKLGSAFWDAFSGAPSSASPDTHSTSSSSAWDTEKVRRVLEGSAVLRVVDVDRPSSSSTSASASNSTPASADALAESMRSLSLNNKQERKYDGPTNERKGFLAKKWCGNCSQH